MRFRRHHTEKGRAESDFLQSLGMGAHPQIALPVGKSRMDFIGKTPVGIRKAVIERTQAISSLIETRKTSAIGMHPNRTENIFVHMKSRTGTVGRCRLYRDYFRFQHFCPCIKMCNGSRNILPEPYFRVSVYINGVNRSTRQTGSRIMNSCLSGRIVSKKSVCLCNHYQIMFVNLSYSHDM